MTAAIVSPVYRAGSGRLLRAEWTKIRSVRSTAWSLVILVVAAIGLNTLSTGITIVNWRTVSAAGRVTYLADPTGFLAAALAFAQIPICVLGVMLISSEYPTGMIRSSRLAVPRRTPMLAAKAGVSLSSRSLSGNWWRSCRSSSPPVRVSFPYAGRLPRLPRHVPINRPFAGRASSGQGAPSPAGRTGRRALRRCGPARPGRFGVR